MRLAGPKTRVVLDFLGRRIASRGLVPGDRLPSVRGLAASLGVSPSTVVDAYDLLVAQGTVKARRGSGYYLLAQPADDEQSRPAGQGDRTVDPLWVSRQSLDASPLTLKPGCGWLPPELLPQEGIRRALRAISRGNSGTLAGYGSVMGSRTLRRLLAGRAAEDGITVSPEQILLTPSGTQAIDLVCRCLLRPDDVVLVDDPCYFNFQALLSAHSARTVGIPFTPSGPDVTAFEQAVIEHRPKLYLSNSALHNPTGGTMSPLTMHKILSIAVRHQMVIIEDDIFADFEPEPSLRLAALDGLTNVIRIGSFSKTLSASVRCGYIVASVDFINKVSDLQVAINFGGPGPVSADVVAHLLTSGGYRKHMDSLHLRLVRSRREVASKLSKCGFEPWLMPRGGYYLWCKLPSGSSAVGLAKAALKEDIVLAPGDVFGVASSHSDYMRFNVEQCSNPRVWAFLAGALKASNG